jgi:hypothetical protein
MEAKRLGIASGGYHWLQPKVDPTVQARYYLDNWYNKNKTDFPPILDFEDRNYNTITDYLWRAQTELDIVEQETGRKPIVYTGGMIGEVLNHSKGEFLSRYPLWLAWYSRYLPKPPNPWKVSGWGAWQYSGKADFPFYANEGDGDGHDWGFDAFSMDVNWATDEFMGLAGVVAQPEDPPVIVDPPTPPVIPSDIDALYSELAIRFDKITHCITK